MRAIAMASAFLLLPTMALAEEETANSLTHGMVQMTLKVGETTQAQVLEVFGAPNITTMDGDGTEMWVYDRHATVSRNSSGGFSIGLGAFGSEVGGVLGFGKKKSENQSSQRTMTLIIKFDDRNVVSDFKSRSSSF